MDAVFEIQQNYTKQPAYIRNKIPIDLEDEVHFRNYETKEQRVNWPLQLIVCILHILIFISSLLYNFLIELKAYFDLHTFFEEIESKI